ncbi:MAG: hypothetical protein CMQ19_01470 [Gammaproteobacteria bacterium]|nr:hypothetical protein [Gammaproteobacteria bacterium]
MVVSRRILFKSSALMFDGMGIVVSQDPFSIWSMQSEGIGNTVRFLLGRFCLHHFEPSHIPTFVMYFLTMKIKEILEGCFVCLHEMIISLNDK